MVFRVDGAEMIIRSAAASGKALIIHVKKCAGQKHRKKAKQERPSIPLLKSSC